MGSTVSATRAEPVESPRVLAYCHDGVGLGHLRRTLNICEHVGATFERATFLIVTGSPYVSLFQQVPRVDYLKLPSLRKVGNEHYVPKFLTLAPKQTQRCREFLLMETARHFDPHVVLVDKAPVGVCGELIPTLYWLRRNRPNTQIIFGMRDIEDDVEVTIQQWTRLGAQAMLEDCFDEVWVYGMRSLFDVASKYELSAGIQAKMRFVGYVARRACSHGESADCKPPLARSKRQLKQVLVTVGGGTDGTRLLETYLGEAAKRTAAMGVRSVIVAGPDLPPDSARLLEAVAARIPNVEWIEFASCMSCRIREADLIVCMGGYNTLCEVARNRKPALVIPRDKPRIEQTMRADLWAKRGAVNVLPPARLSPRTLADRVIELLEHDSGPTTPDLDLEGLDVVRERFGALLNGGVAHAAAVSV